MEMVTRSVIDAVFPATLATMKLNLTADEVLTTTRSVRKRLDFDRPVDRAVVEECLEIAIQAPTGSNSQGWHWVVVEDEAKRQAIADVYRANFNEYRNMPPAVYKEGDSRGERMDKVRDSATYLSENFHRAPLMLIPCLWGRLDGASVDRGAGFWGSLLPAVWSFMLALRERGLGSAWTTIHMMNDGERQVADLLGIPFDKVSQGGLFPIAYTIGTDFKPAKREPLARILHWDRW
jgi:nitroreductase